jgi:hypothetical protein
MLLQSVILGSQNDMRAVDGAAIESRIRTSRPDEGKEDARVQEHGIRAKIFLSASSSP